MISGATYTLPLNIRYPLQNTEKIIITLKNEATGIKRTKHYPNNEETWMMADGRIGVRLTQQDTIDLVGYVKIEAQINLKSGAVAKTKTERTYIASTLNTEIVEGAMDNGENLLDGVTLELGAPITAEGGEGTSFQPGNALELKDGILNVLTTDDAEKGNNLPITSEGARKLAYNISYNDLKNRPFWRETKRERLVKEEYLPNPVITVTTTDDGGFNIAQNEFLDYMPDTTNIVVFDGVEYECEPHYDESAGAYVIGTSDFTDYPFCITYGMIITETAGTHTIEQFFDKVETKYEYLPFLTVETLKNSDKTPYLELEDIERIKHAWENGIPVRINTNVGNLIVQMNVVHVDVYIIAVNYHVNSRSLVEQVLYSFDMTEGILKFSAKSYLGNLNDSGTDFPILLMRNAPYKIDVDSDGKLTATKL